MSYLKSVSIQGAIGLLLGVMIGQVSMVTAIDPLDLKAEAYDLARRAYLLSCQREKGHDCPAKADAFIMSIKSN